MKPKLTHESFGLKQTHLNLLAEVGALIGAKSRGEALRYVLDQAYDRNLRALAAKTNPQPKEEEEEEEDRA